MIKQPSIICLCTTVMLLLLMESSSARAASSTPSLFSISPKMCIKPSDETPCQVQLAVNITFNELTDFCIQSKQLGLRQCINQQQEFHYEQTFEADQDIEIVLMTATGELHQRIFKVGNYEKVQESKKSRIRRNMGWIY